MTKGPNAHPRPQNSPDPNPIYHLWDVTEVRMEAWRRLTGGSTADVLVSAHVQCSPPVLDKNTLTHFSQLSSQQ